MAERKNKKSQYQNKYSRTGLEDGKEFNVSDLLKTVILFYR